MVALGPAVALAKLGELSEVRAGADGVELRVQLRRAVEGRRAAEQQRDARTAAQRKQRNGAFGRQRLHHVALVTGAREDT